MGLTVSMWPVHVSVSHPVAWLISLIMIELLKRRPWPSTPAAKLLSAMCSGAVFIQSYSDSSSRNFASSWEPYLFIFTLEPLGRWTMHGLPWQRN